MRPRCCLNKQVVYCGTGNEQLRASAIFLKGRDGVVDDERGSEDSVSSPGMELGDSFGFCSAGGAALDSVEEMIELDAVALGAGECSGDSSSDFVTGNGLESSSSVSSCDVVAADCGVSHKSLYFKCVAAAVALVTAKIGTSVSIGVWNLSSNFDCCSGCSVCGSEWEPSIGGVS